MGLHNILVAPLRCPHCQHDSEVEVELKFGLVDLTQFVVGDTYKWKPRKAVQNGGRPDGGNVDGEGYAVCPRCEGNYFVVVRIRGDQITSAEPDVTRPGYI